MQAFKEAQKYSKPSLIWSGKSEKHTKIPCLHDLEQNADAKFLHICANETTQGVEYKDYSSPKNGILVVDMSSNFCSKPVDVSKCGLVFEDLLDQGGLVEVEKKNKKKAEILYNAYDGSNGFYRCPV
nr:phosphoserine aminotransferase 1, chloroplastic [Quercus suber]